MTSTLLAREGAVMGRESGDARRLVLSRLVVEHRMRPQDPMSLDKLNLETTAAELLLDDGVPSLERVREALSA